MTRSIQEITRLAGVSSRTLRHYDQIGLLPPSGTGTGGLRCYDDAALRRLQRILLLRDLGLPLADIGSVLDEQADEARALRGHLSALRAEQGRLARQVASVERTLTAVEKGERIMAEEMLDGFDHTQHEHEVTERWGADAYARGDAWWRGLGAEGQAGFKAVVARLNEDWVALASDAARTDAASGTGSSDGPTSDAAQALAARHVAWLGSVPGTPGSEQGRPPKEYVVGLAEMYATDPRFAKNYGGTEGATFVRDALVVYAEREL